MFFFNLICGCRGEGEKICGKNFKIFFARSRLNWATVDIIFFFFSLRFCFGADGTLKWGRCVFFVPALRFVVVIRGGDIKNRGGNIRHITLVRPPAFIVKKKL